MRVRSVLTVPVDTLGRLRAKTPPCNAAEKARAVTRLKLTIARSKAILKSLEKHIERYEKAPTTIPPGASEAAHNATLDSYIKRAVQLIKNRKATEALLQKIEALPTEVDVLNKRAQEAEARLATCTTQREAEEMAKEAAQARADATQAELEETAARVIPRGKLLVGAAVAFTLGRMIR